MPPLYRLDSHYLLIIHRWVYRNFVENCILNVPVGTELHINGRKDHYLTNRFVRTEEGFLYDPMVHADECNRFVFAYVSNPMEWILTPETMGTLILDGFDTKPPTLYVYTDQVKLLIWTDHMVWTVGKRLHPDWKLVGYIQWKSVRNPQSEEKKVYKSFHEFLGEVDKIRE
ncbi:hypothetical protein TNCT_703411 [Trichonephila clavata]|uniref:Uncharacterized protein n=1 Tax=Trichonephila clavata TaxID=2740835 RepID=A0A8X6F6V1_TRICU|nr:hypothetical protein TNCT_703411 [Trichonephila clavata]